MSRREKWRTYRRTRAQALREIKAARYDLAIDLYWQLPNTLPLLWQARIPVRAGYGNGGFGPLATHCLSLTKACGSVLERHRDLLKLLSLGAKSLAKMTPVLPPVSDEAVDRLNGELRLAGMRFGEYLVFHPGAGDGFREWPEGNWRALAERLTAEGFNIVFTGYSEREAAMIGRISYGLPRCFSLCGRLPWPGFVAALQQARLLVCVDTVAGHVAGAVGTPSAVLTAGRWPYLWPPVGAPTQILMAAVPCAPCHRNNGCAGMECIQNLEVEMVCRACFQLMNLPRSESHLRLS